MASPWETPKPEDLAFTNFGIVEIQMETRKGRSTWFLARITASPLNGEFEVQRSSPSFTSEFTRILLPSLQEIVQEHDFLIFPTISESPGAKSDVWEFYAKWKMLPYKDFSDNSVEYFKNSDKPERVLADKKGREYIEKTMFKFLVGYPNQAACMLAMESEFPPSSEDSDDIPGFDAPDPLVSTPTNNILTMMLNGVWDNDRKHFTGLKDALTATDTDLSDHDTRIIVYTFLNGKANGDGEDLATILEKFSTEFGAIDANEWLTACPIFD